MSDPAAGVSGQLEYEETPVIDPSSLYAPSTPAEQSPQVPSTVYQPYTPTPPPQETPQPSWNPAPQHDLPDPLSRPELPEHHGGIVGNIVLFAVLFAVGIGLSFFLRQYLPNPSTLTNSAPSSDAGTNGTPFPTREVVPADPYAGWATYQVVNGLTRQPVSGVNFQLPKDVLAPICDGATCGSQGTYLAGGTRFTIAARGAGQVLADYRGRIISDLTGKEFTVKRTTNGDRSAVEFISSFTGSTVGGYGFSQMRGVMIEVTDTLSIELNHFVPNGVNANFAVDDILFEKILKTISFSGLTPPKPTAAPTVTVLPTKFPTVTPLETIQPTASPTAVPTTTGIPTRIPTGTTPAATPTGGFNPSAF